MTTKEIKRLLVIGAGQMGPQIAWQGAVFGLEVWVYGRSEISLARARRHLKRYVNYLRQGGHLSADQEAAAWPRLHWTTDPEAAAAAADLVSESVPENLALKRQVWEQFGPLTPPTAILTTNSSVLLPSELAAASGRSERFLAWHFHQPCFIKNLVDIMPHPGTDPACVATLADLSRRLQLQPLILQKENRGYVFNAMLTALLHAALELALNGVAGIEEIDQAWQLIMETPAGPFGIMDRVGLDTVAEVLQLATQVRRGNPFYAQALAWLEPKLAQGHLGQKSGQGFYNYRRPAAAEISAALPLRKNRPS